MAVIKRTRHALPPPLCWRCLHLEKDHMVYVKVWATGEMEAKCTTAGCDCAQPSFSTEPRQALDGRWTT